ncbi:hypothetical protein ACWFMI_23760 [Nocardiopsis terrae]
MSVEAPEQVRPDLLSDTTLRELEGQTERQLWATILPTATTQGATGATLRLVVERVVELVRSATSRAMTLGAALAHSLAPSAVLADRRAPTAAVPRLGFLGLSGSPDRPAGGPTSTLPTPGQVATTVVSQGLEEEVRGWLGRAAAALDSLPAGAPPERRMRRLEQIVRGLWGHTVTRLHRLVNAGAVWFSERFEFGLLWHTRNDERLCPSCWAMNARVLTSARARFAAPSGEGIPALWEGFAGLPPLHPRCRCFVRPVAR